MTTREEKEQRIRDLKNELYYSEECGDWMIARYQEEKEMGLTPSYDIEELHTKRQEIRLEIRRLEDELKGE